MIQQPEASMKIRALGFAVVLAGLVAVLPTNAQAQKRDRDKITREDIEGSAQKDQDIYQVIRSLRPHFLAPARGSRSMGGSSSPMALYVDGVRETDVNQLKAIPASVVEEVRYLDPTRSESEYGSNAAGGAVVVKRMKGGAAAPTPATAPKDTTKPPQH
jgi:hypothetical protein